MIRTLARVSFVALLVGSCAPCWAGPVDDAVTWLESNQDQDGSWGSLLPVAETSTVVETLADLDLCLGSLAGAAGWLEGQADPNTDSLARRIAGLGNVPDHEGAARTLAAGLLALRNPVENDTGLPNWPEGGWGLDTGFATDCMTTALAMLALDHTGFNGGVSVTNGAVAPLGTSIHEWEIPDDATVARILITVAGSQIRLCMTEGAPPPFCSSFFPLLGGPFLIVFPDSGLPFTPGNNFIVIESPIPPGLAATYSMTASYETPTLDTRSLAEPLEYLRESQNGDGGWGLQRGQPSDLYTTLHVLLGLQQYAQYEFDAEISAGIAYVKSLQLGDGSFGFGGPGIPYVTALAALNLIRSESSPFSTETEDAVSALLAMQDVDGSWGQEPYDTALAALALWVHDLPPTADAGPDQLLADTADDCVESIDLSGAGSSVDGMIQGYRWTEDCEEVATGASPTIPLGVGDHDLMLTVTEDSGQTDQDHVLISITGTDTDLDGVSVCEDDCNDLNHDVWAAPGEALDLFFTDGVELTWSPPVDLGSISVVYDLLRSEAPDDFTISAAVCVDEAGDDTDRVATDAEPPPLGAIFHYLVRAHNDCPLGDGSLGTGASGERVGRSCP